MTIPTGHATSAEKAHIAGLAEKLRSGRLTSDERLELALLNIEPLHDGFRAAELLRELLAENRQHELAKLWLAHVYIFHFMDEDALNEAVRLCEELLAASARPETRAAAHLLKADALRQLGDRDPVPDLRQSVALAPTWVGNRLLLAQIDEERGHLSAAQDQLREALEAIGSWPVPADFASRMFEMLITSRWRPEHTMKDLEMELRRLAAKAGGQAE